jgi:hypothetical protein
VGAHLWAWMVATTVHRITLRAKEVGEGWERGGRRLLRGKQIEIEREGAHMGGGGARGMRPGPGRAGLGRVRLGLKPTTQATTDRKPNTNQNPKRGETDARLNTTSDKRNMLRYDATPMST